MPDREVLPKKAQEDLTEIERAEQRATYGRRMEKMNRRLSKYALDPDNKKMYRARAEQWAEYTEKWQSYHEKQLAKAEKSGIINTGAISGALNPNSKEALAHAERYYEFVRHQTTDTARIAKNTVISQTKIDKIKKHVFIDEHELLDGVKRFDPSYHMAESWQRLATGNYRKEDIILLKHEYAELRLMEKGYSQDAAHIRASKRYNYAKYCD